MTCNLPDDGGHARRTAKLTTGTAGAGSLVLEYALLSRLTGDSRFEALAHRAFMGLWNRRSEEDLVGNGINVKNGQWLVPLVSGVQAGIDSYFEYALKAAIMLGECPCKSPRLIADDAQYMDIFYDAYAAIQTHVRTDDGFFVSFRRTDIELTTVPSHQPAEYGARVTIIRRLALCFLPRRHGTRRRCAECNQVAPCVLECVAEVLRAAGGLGPELARSRMGRLAGATGVHRIDVLLAQGKLLCPSMEADIQATGDDFYLKVGERVLEDITRRAVTSCGLASLGNVETGKQEDRMESFFLSETLKVS